MRRLLVLLRGLPADAAIVRVEDPRKGWTDAIELAALTLEAISQLTVVVIKIASERGARVPDPIRVPRPYDVDGRPRLSSKGEVVRFFRARGVPVRYTPRQGTGDDVPG